MHAGVNINDRGGDEQEHDRHCDYDGVVVHPGIAGERPEKKDIADAGR